MRIAKPRPHNKAAEQTVLPEWSEQPAPCHRQAFGPRRIGKAAPQHWKNWERPERIHVEIGPKASKNFQTAEGGFQSDGAAEGRATGTTPREACFGVALGTAHKREARPGSFPASAR